MTADDPTSDWLASRDLDGVVVRLHRLSAMRPDRHDAQWTAIIEVASRLDGLGRWGSLQACSFLGHTLRDEAELLSGTSLAQLSGALHFEWRAYSWGSGRLEQALLVANEIRSRLIDGRTGDEDGSTFTERYGAVLTQIQTDERERANR